MSLKPTVAEAKAFQTRMAAAVVKKNGFEHIKTIAGIDVGFPDQGRTTRAAVVVMDSTANEIIDTAVVEEPTRFPYIPGLLSFREVPTMLQALHPLRHMPDVILVDGQGLAHPRRFGSACHLGLEADIPTIGVGKSRLCGAHARLNAKRGSVVSLVDDKHVIGKVVRTRDTVNPLFVAIGHRVHLRTAIRIVLEAAWRYRLPEPIRHADRLTRR